MFAVYANIEINDTHRIQKAVLTAAEDALSRSVQNALRQL